MFAHFLVLSPLMAQLTRYSIHYILLSSSRPLKKPPGHFRRAAMRNSRGPLIRPFSTRSHFPDQSYKPGLDRTNLSNVLNATDDMVAQTYGEIAPEDKTLVTYSETTIGEVLEKKNALRAP